VTVKKPIEKEALNTALLPFLEKKLPYYMIPGDIDLVSDFPYSSSHKIDKNKLIENYLQKQFKDL
jgi:acyl-CoA synthetase (AMP-forming)/AMP-acid ligase II